MLNNERRSEGLPHHGVVEVRLIAFGGVGHQGKLGNAKDLSFDVFDAGLPHGTALVVEYAHIQDLLDDGLNIAFRIVWAIKLMSRRRRVWRTIGALKGTTYLFQSPPVPKALSRSD